MEAGFNKRIIIGIEIEAYSIDLAEHKIGRRLSKPRPGLSESGERFTRDTSIGSEYNSRPFTTIREALFLLKSGLRKYMRGLYRSTRPDQDYRLPLLIGSWTNRFAGTHMHMSVAERSLSAKDATSLAWHLHDHIPFLIAIGANSPVWGKQVTNVASNRVVRGSEAYFSPLKRGELNSQALRELVYSPGRKTKPATLEMRVLDSNLPEFIVANMTLVKAICLRWLRHKSATNRIPHATYLQARQEAGARGMKTKLPWKEETLSVPDYLDRFLWEHRDECAVMDIPEEIYDTLRLLKRGYNGARIYREAAQIAVNEHPQTWQRRFAKRYSQGLERLLSGDSLRAFADALQVSLPNTDRVWLGRKRASIDE